MTRKKYPFEHAKAMYSKWFWQLQNPNLFIGIKTKQSILLQIYLDIYLRYFNAAALFFSWWLMFHCCCIVPLLMIDVSLQLHCSSPDDWCFIAAALFFSEWLTFRCSLPEDFFLLLLFKWLRSKSLILLKQTNIS